MGWMMLKHLYTIYYYITFHFDKNIHAMQGYQAMGHCKKLFHSNNCPTILLRLHGQHGPVSSAVVLPWNLTHRAPKDLGDWTILIHFDQSCSRTWVCKCLRTYLKHDFIEQIRNRPLPDALIWWPPTERYHMKIGITRAARAESTLLKQWPYCCYRP